MKTALLLTEKRDRIGTIQLNRPERHNALSPELLLELHATLTGWAREDEIRTVVIRGAGDKAFSAGYDIPAIPTSSTPETEKLLREKNPLELGLESIKHFPYPTIAMLNGHCFGAALNLALCCDLRLGADDIAVGMPAAKLGLVYPPAGIVQFVRVLGLARSREVFFAGRTYRGEVLASMGLVDKLVPRAELEETTYALAGEIAANAPLALRGLKRVLDLVESSITIPAEARGEAAALVAASLSSEDAREAQAAFVEKRKPRFAGR